LGQFSLRLLELPLQEIECEVMGQKPAEDGETGAKMLECCLET
jgi:hypothetical protein